MIRDLIQYLLPSGRGVRVVELFPSEKDDVERKSAHEIGKDGTFSDLRLAMLRRGVYQMVKQVTASNGTKKAEDLLSPDTKWKVVDLSDLEDNYDKYFTSKDDAVLGRIYHKLHEISADEIDAIVGKAQTVSAG